MRLPEKSAEQPLSGKQLRNKIADVTCFNIFCIKLGLRETLVKRVSKDRGDILALTFPIPGKVRLAATQDINHVILLVRGYCYTSYRILQ